MKIYQCKRLIVSRVKLYKRFIILLNSNGNLTLLPIDIYSENVVVILSFLSTYITQYF